MKKWIAETAVFLLIIIALVYHFISLPTQGVISEKKAVEVKKADVTGLKKYDGKLISFSYPDKYDLREGEVKDVAGESWLLIGKSQVPYQITIGIKDSPEKDINDISAVQFRRLKADVYQESITGLDGLRAVYFKKKDGGELTVLTIDKGKLISLSLTSTTNDPETETEFSGFLEGVKLHLE